MSGSIVSVAIATGLVALTAATLPVMGALVVRQTVAGAADAAALAAADVAVGLVGGFPCETASRVAAANGAGIDSCRVDGLVATVTASRGILGISVRATATAGPPP